MNFIKRPIELLSFAAVLLLANVSLFKGSPSVTGIFFPDRVIGGEYWRVLTYPFVHVSGYHLLIDGLGFAFVYSCLKELRFTDRAVLFLGASIGSLLLPLMLTDDIYRIGLCGLSGPAHGIMAVVSLEFIKRSEDQKWMGVVSLLLVAGKSVLEIALGNVIFAGVHMGSLGYPIASCHLGGILGGAAVWFLANPIRDRLTQEIESVEKFDNGAVIYG